VGEIPISRMYPTLRTIHLLCGAFALPMLLMYGVSAVQMAHTKWFSLTPVISESAVRLSREYIDGRLLARELMTQGAVRGEINSVEETSSGFTMRIVVPGTVHEVHYDRAAAEVRVKTSVAGFMGMWNRLHHAAGLWHEYGPLKMWAVFVGIVSLATVGLAATGLWMWWLRRQERTWGMVLLGANVAFALTVLTLIRLSGW
jgi:hypothetical protein